MSNTLRHPSPCVKGIIPHDSWQPIDLTTLPDKPPVQPTLGSTSLVYPGKRHVFSGPPESAKTLAAYCILIQIARHNGTGILIDFEMGAYDARKRLEELGATDTEVSRILYLEPDTPATPERIERLITLRPQLVVVDAAAGAYQLEGLDDNKRTDVEKLARHYVTAFWRANIATIHIDHVVKNTETRGRFVIGSERKLGAADVHLGFDTITPISRGTAGKYKITTHKDRGGYLRRGHLADLHLNSDPDTNAIDWTFTEPVVTTDDHGKFRYTILMEKISDTLRHVDEPLSKAEVKRRVGGNGDQLGKAIDSLIAEHHLDVSNGPRGSVLVQLRTPYTRADDPKENGDNTDANAPANVLFSSSSRPTEHPTCSTCSSPIPNLFQNGSPVTCSTCSTPYRGNRTGTAVTTTPEPDDLFHSEHGWFDADGNLYDPTQQNGHSSADDIDFSPA